MQKIYDLNWSSKASDYDQTSQLGDGIKNQPLSIVSTKTNIIHGPKSPNGVENSRQLFN